ncbi:unnamed protein product [Caenorhabditis auriculariae]|uniref:K Homology domain-containing protein n=1 Tax=Caenorhabditis auriculariae TaxID=2777116 RepID=A0A8S1HTT0_9PELO|nr:unnamed protein product [Caenorhabditis auriculariae]
MSRQLKIALATTAICGAGALYWAYAKKKKEQEIEFLFESATRKIEQNSDFLPSEDEESEEEVQETVLRLPDKAVGAVIGRHGRNLRIIERETMSVLTIASFSNDRFRSLRKGKIDGDWGWGSKAEEEDDWFEEKDVTRSELEMLQFLVVRAPSKRQMEMVRLRVREIVNSCVREDFEASFTVNRSVAGYIIGRNGRNIKKIAAQFGVKIQDNSLDVVEILIKGRHQYGVHEAEVVLRNTWKNVTDEDVKKYRKSSSDGLQDDVQDELKELEHLVKTLDVQEEEVW